ncbi:hypothetical protein H8959_015962 [Pygathrix nigripes]
MSAEIPEAASAEEQKNSPTTCIVSVRFTPKAVPRVRVTMWAGLGISGPTLVTMVSGYSPAFSAFTCKGGILVLASHGGVRPRGGESPVVFSAVCARKGCSQWDSDMVLD